MSFDASLIGEKEGSGAEHTVHEIIGEPDKVVKIPHFGPRAFGAHAEQIKEDIATTEAHFPGLILPTEVHGSRKDYHIIQKRLPKGSRELTPSDLLQRGVREKFERLLSMNRVLINETGSSLELLGRSGGVGIMLGAPKLGNVFVTKEREIILPDTTLMQIKKNPYHRFCYELWRALIQEHFINEQGVGYDTSLSQ
ncbi:hypothetical protein KA050_01675 [Candidatus Gracilibacteria bacterium]|nr:hypothetical protein [Candidatus Gracilibacteria bacterium]